MVSNFLIHYEIHKNNVKSKLFFHNFIFNFIFLRFFTYKLNFCCLELMLKCDKIYIHFFFCLEIISLLAGYILFKSYEKKIIIDLFKTIFFDCNFLWNNHAA